ncbi:MAG: hypothetical protein AAF639_21110 [Chloroflexota bacterium]
MIQAQYTCFYLYIEETIIFYCSPTNNEHHITAIAQQMARKP